VVAAALLALWSLGYMPAAAGSIAGLLYTLLVGLLGYAAILRGASAWAPTLLGVAAASALSGHTHAHAVAHSLRALREAPGDTSALPPLLPLLAVALILAALPPIWSWWRPAPRRRDTRELARAAVWAAATAPLWMAWALAPALEARAESLGQAHASVLFAALALALSLLAAHVPGRQGKPGRERSRGREPAFAAATIAVLLAANGLAQGVGFHPWLLGAGVVAGGAALLGWPPSRLARLGFDAGHPLPRVLAVGAALWAAGAALRGFAAPGTYLRGAMPFLDVATLAHGVAALGAFVLAARASFAGGTGLAAAWGRIAGGTAGVVLVFLGLTLGVMALWTPSGFLAFPSPRDARFDLVL
jgi:hypothetical protein